MKYKYIFGPVNSRRFGVSLGIDLSPEKKQCNFDCLYCELEKAKPVNKMEGEPEPEEILNEIKIYLDKNSYPDVITITANGEPTLYSKLSELVDGLNSIKGNSKLLILSNGSLIWETDIQKTLSKIDIVKISLDSVNQRIFRKVDKPDNSIDVNKIISGLIEFRKIFKGKLIIEIMIVKYVNNTVENLEEIREVLKKINPDRVDLGTIDRPPAYRVFPVSDEELLELGKVLKDFNLNILFSRNEYLDKKLKMDIDRLLETIKRRPLSLEEINEIYNDEVIKTIDNLIHLEILKLKKVGSKTFLTLSKNKRKN